MAVGPETAKSVIRNPQKARCERIGGRLCICGFSKSSPTKEMKVRRTITMTATCAILGLGFFGCASSGTPGTAKVTESSPDRLTAVEIESQGGAQTAYDVVRRLRPRWLQAGATGSIGGGRIQSQVLLVYLDGNKLGTAETLRTLTATGIKSMQYYDAVRAATILREVGSEPISGAIVITTHQ
jgi:hypothetical protein